MSLTITVYSKNGCCCPGPPIGNASFRAVSKGIVVFDIPLPATNGGPLTGSTHIYTVENPRALSEFWLRVQAPNHNDWDFFVLDGSKHDVWLSKAQ